jgi:hypothetical protein
MVASGRSFRSHLLSGASQSRGRQRLALEDQAAADLDTARRCRRGKRFPAW